MEYNTKGKVLKKAVVWQELYFYRKSDALYQLTVQFCRRFLPAHGDRTVDQMIQAARSGKQNIVEGSADGTSSSEMELKLLTVARGSIKELREDYEDYLNVRGLKIWDAAHPSFNRMLEYCRTHNQPADYEPFLPRLTDEKIANMSLTLCHMVDKMMLTYQSNLEKRFVEEGGIRERMTAARLGYRNQQKQTIISLKQTITQLQQENQQLMARIAFLERQLNNNQPT